MCLVELSPDICMRRRTRCSVNGAGRWFTHAGKGESSAGARRCSATVRGLVAKEVDCSRLRGRTPRSSAGQCIVYVYGVLTDDMLLLLWRALVVQVSKLLEAADTTGAKSDKTDAFTSMLAALRVVVTGQRLQPHQLLVSVICFILLLPSFSRFLC